jgi:hypothetical protein
MIFSLNIIYLVYKTYMNILKINSKYKSSGTDGDFEYVLPRNLTISKMKLLKSIIPNSMYIINTNNSSLFITQGGTDIEIILPVGNYNPSTLCTMLTNYCTTYHMTFTYDSTLMRIVIACTGATTINFSQCQLLAKLLGFNPVNVTGLNFGSDNTCRIINTTYYHVCFGTLQNNNIISNVNSFFTIMNTGTIGDVIASDYFLEQIEISNPQLMNKLHIQIKDENYNVVDFNGQNILLELIIE